eukprot:scaffold23140_cov178-Amphora_coffeaeformis.AAC.6
MRLVSVSVEESDESRMRTSMEKEVILLIRVHSIDFALPVQTRGQIYAKLFAAKESSTSMEILSISMETSTFPLEIPFSLQLLSSGPASMKWADGKKCNASVRYCVGAHIISTAVRDTSIQESIYLLPPPSILEPAVP